MSKKLNRKARLYLIATIISVGLVSAGIALAYFAADIQGFGAAGLTTSVGDNPELVFTSGDGFVINASEDNFTEGGDHLYDETTSTATLVADSDVTATYNVYFNISLNEFVYTSEEEFPELLLVIYVDGEIYTGDTFSTVTYDGITGIDVTTTEGLIQIASDYSISSTVDEQEWTAVLYFINLDSNQIENSSKSFSGTFILGEPLTLNEAILINNGTDKYETDEDGNTTEVPADSLDDAIAYISAKDTPSTYASTAKTDEGMYATEDDYGTSYYFRGAVDDNWVIFGEEDGKPIYWRIIRIDGEGNVRMIYSGTTAPVVNEEEGIDQSVVMTGDQTTIGDAQYYSSSNDASYVGYQRIEESIDGYSGSIEDTDDTPAIDSSVKDALDYWYENKLSSAYYDYIADVIYCNDRTLYSTTTISENYLIKDYDVWYNYYKGTATYFASRLRVTGDVPSLKCSYKEDSFTVTNELGNQALTYPVALITADEVDFAGGEFGVGNSYYYLYTNDDYWTLSPSNVYSYSSAVVFAVGSAGFLNNNTASNSYGVRPVVSLSSEIFNFTGSGTWDDPYKIV